MARTGTHKSSFSDEPPERHGDQDGRDPGSSAVCSDRLHRAVAVVSFIGARYHPGASERTR